MATGTDFLSLDPADLPARGLAAWLAARIRAAVVDGTLVEGAALPSQRGLAQELGISRGVVVEAYRRLADEGLVRSRGGALTEVASRVGASGAVASAPSLPAAFLVPRLGSPAELDLSPGVPDLSAFPRAAWLRAERAVLAEGEHTALGYGDPHGHPVLRTALARWLATHRGLRCGPDELLVVAGVSQALALLTQVLARSGVERWGIEDPGSRGVRDQLAAWGRTAVPIPVDADGLDVGALTASGVSVVAVTPAHQFPTGVVLGPERRRELLAWAADGGLVLEDDYDAEHRYDRAPVPALQPSAPASVAYTGSVSKTLAPGLRLGWVVPPAHLLDDLVAAKYAIDISSPSLPQLVLARLMAGGDLERHLRVVRTRQRRRRDALIAGLHRHVPSARVHGVAAGLHLVVTFPGAVRGVEDDEALATELAAVGVVAHPLSWHRMRPGPPGLVIGYAAQPPDRLVEAARRLGSIVGAVT